MFLDAQGLQRADFEPEVLASLDEFRSVVTAMNETAAPQLLPEHFLMALLRAPGSWLGREFTAKGVRGEMLASQIGRSIAEQKVVIHQEITRECVSPDAEAMFRAMADRYAKGGVPAGRQELVLTEAALRGCRPRTVRLFEFGGLPADRLLAKLADEVVMPEAAAICPFAADGSTAPEAFDLTAKRILKRLETEGSGLGLDFIGTPLLLLALVGQEDGITDHALRAQQVPPRAISEELLVRLRGLGTKQLSGLKATEGVMHATVANTFRRAARDAQEHRFPQIGEAQLLRALVAEDATLVGSILREHHVDAEELRDYALKHHNPAAAQEQAAELPSVEAIIAALRRRIVGQDHVIEALRPLLKRLRFNYSRPNKPMGVFLFLGPSGTGKTELAKTLANCLYGSEDQMIFLEMGQFGAEHDKSMFIGAPPGYVGYGEGQLTNGLRDRPEAVVLFDEVEKAHRSVFDVLLRFLDEGIIRDPAGQVRDGRKCLIVLTSNILLDDVCDFGAGTTPLPLREGHGEGRASGIEPPTLPAPSLEGRGGGGRSRPTLEGLYQLDPHTRQATIRNALRKIEFFRPEFINRVDEVVLFRPLDASDYSQIVATRLAAEAERLHSEKDRELLYGGDLVELLGRRCTARANEGARVVGKVIALDVMDPAIDFFVLPGNEACTRARVRVEGERIAIERA